ncbi:MAG: hypothetical protein LUH08_06030 [Ruminococcus sp.]|nr:hypothetical protein [Ruminococcus sp.]
MSEMVYYEMKNDGKQKLTEEQLKMLEEAENEPITFDEDCPELTPAMIKAFRCSAAWRNRHGLAPQRED